MIISCTLKSQISCLVAEVLSLHMNHSQAPCCSTPVTIKWLKKSHLLINETIFINETIETIDMYPFAIDLQLDCGMLTFLRTDSNQKPLDVSRKVLYCTGRDWLELNRSSMFQNSSNSQGTVVTNNLQAKWKQIWYGKFSWSFEDPFPIFNHI
jgi:hypothetical protein